jgi:hypothetical protein
MRGSALYLVGTLALFSIAAFCYRRLATPITRNSRPATLTTKSVKQLETLTLADRYYLENRYGKKIRAINERSRRAATVC